MVNLGDECPHNLGGMFPKKLPKNEQQNATPETMGVLNCPKKETIFRDPILLLVSGGVISEICWTKSLAPFMARTPP